jgi:ribonuclease HII
LSTTKNTINEIKNVIHTITDEQDPMFQSLLRDNRAGVKKIVAQWYRKRQIEAEQLDQFKQISKYEQELRDAGFTHIAGIDEVGRGPLAGPVVSAAVILPADFYLAGINDSKKLTEANREKYYEYIMTEAVAVGIGSIDAKEIDKINIYEATKKAMLAAVNNLAENPDYLLIDAMKLENSYPSKSIIKGDAKSISIAAASIVAKVSRDRLMKQYEEEYPGYGFTRNMGYGTKEHLQGLEKIGPSPIHRKSFAPVKNVLTVNERK